jgi:cytochrome P450
VSDQVDLMDPATIECPYPAYERLRDEAPVYFEPTLQMYVITRYDDVRAVLRDTKRFVVSNRRMHPRQDLINETFVKAGGVVPAAAMTNLDNPEHRVLRGLYNDTFAPASIERLAGYVTDLAHQVIDRFIDRGRCELIRDFTTPFPLGVIGNIMGIEDPGDLARIKIWTDAWVQRRGLQQSDAEVVRTTELEVEAQKFFQPIIDRLREDPEAPGLLGEVVRAVVPEWGNRRMNDAEAQTACLQEMFVAGAETTTSAFGHALKILIENRGLQERLRADLDLVPAFVEELLRFESPVQSHFRRVTADAEIHGVLIPAGSMVNIRYASANRDDRQFDDPEEIRLDRPNSGRHLGFGQGTHLCLGASLARLELRIGLRALLERLAEVWFIDGANDFAHHPNIVVRGLKELHIGFTAAARQEAD